MGEKSDQEGSEEYERNMGSGSARHTEVDTEQQSPIVRELKEAMDKMRRSTTEKTAPNTSVAGSYPILVKGEQIQYVPWGSQDLAGIVARLPNINDGASKWIRTFEEQMMGKMVAVGDLKALWARVLRISKMESILNEGGLGQLLNEHSDGLVFDSYRQRTWEALRNEYPTRIDPKNLKGQIMSSTENPATYIQKQVMRWRMETQKQSQCSQSCLGPPF